jgi:hypothetical protein
MILATVAWAVGEVLMGRSAAADRVARASWTVAVGLALLHVWLAFELVYAWSHEAAIEATVRQAADRFGTGWRGGIYLNYAFLVIWLADVCWWWAAPAARASRPRAIETARRALFLFMFVNGAVVFASGAGRVIGSVAVFSVLVAALARRNGLILAPVRTKGANMRFTIVLAALGLSISTAVRAQAPASPQKDDDRKTITVVGCLQTGAQPNQFVLAATADPLAKGVAVATSGAVPNITYQLSGGSNLQAHVGHRVEITGKTTGKAQTAVATDANVKRDNIPGKPDPKVETKEKAAIELRDLAIDSLKMVSTDCTVK